MGCARVFEKPKYYRIRVHGRLNHQWKDWFDGFEITHEAPDITVLTGIVFDQPQLYGILMKIRDLNLTLISVNRHTEN